MSADAPQESSLWPPPRHNLQALDSDPKAQVSLGIDLTSSAPDPTQQENKNSNPREKGAIVLCRSSPELERWRATRPRQKSSSALMSRDMHIQTCPRDHGKPVGQPSVGRLQRTSPADGWTSRCPPPVWVSVSMGTPTMGSRIEVPPNKKSRMTL